jgi:hypothetical protein
MTFQFEKLLVYQKAVDFADQGAKHIEDVLRRDSVSFHP